MHRAKKQIKENLKRVDVILEVMDSRAPLSSRNPLIDELVGQKPRILLLNKSDLSDPLSSELWIKEFNKLSQSTLLLSATNKKTLPRIIKQCNTLFREKKWFQRRPVRAMILGIPNVGKSTIINGLSGGKKAGVANTPGFTKDIIRYDTKKNLQIYDSPGVLWPKFEDPQVGLKLAVLGAIKDTILPIEEVASFGLEKMCTYYPDSIFQRYKLEIQEQDKLKKVAQVRGALLPGGLVDREKAAYLFLNDLREGRLGKFTLETPGQDES